MKKTYSLIISLFILHLSIAQSSNDNTSSVNYCAATGGCGEYISGVTLGTMSNFNDVCSGYADYSTFSESIPINSSAILTVYNGVNLYPSDQCGVWIDWNNNGDFTDPGEQISVSGTPGVGPYTATIAPPITTTYGYKTMRIRIAYLGALSPCGTTPYGEVEDYSVYVDMPLTNYWTGALSNNWGTPGNWSLGHVPTLIEDVVLTGNGFQPIVAATPGTTSAHCNNLTINGGATLYAGDITLTVDNDLTIYGHLAVTSPSSVIRVGSDWNDAVWPSGFTRGSGRVVFTGTTPDSYCSSEYFNILEINLPGNLTIGNAIVTCNTYDWTNGGVLVQADGAFWANDLLDNGISGRFIAQYGSYIRLTNSTTGWVDLNGDLQVLGGQVEVFGTVSQWPYNHNAAITVTDGMLTFTCGISILMNGYSLNSNITGGIIRTNQSFSSNRPDFVPTGGQITMSGPADATLSLTNGSKLWRVQVNKDPGTDAPAPPSPRIPSSRGVSLTDTPLTNKVSLAWDCEVQQDLTVSAGTLSLNGRIATIHDGVFVYGNLEMTNPMDVLNAGVTTYGMLLFYAGSSANLTAGNIHTSQFVVYGGSVFSTAGNTVHLDKPVFNLLRVDVPGVNFGNVVIDSPGSEIFFSAYDPAQIDIAGNLILQTNNSLQLSGSQVLVHGNVTCQPDGNIWLNTGVSDHPKTPVKTPKGTLSDAPGFLGGSLTIDGMLGLLGGLYIWGATVQLYGPLAFYDNALMEITENGSFTCDDPGLVPGWNLPVYGHLNIQSGLFQISNLGIDCGTASSQITMSGGTLRSGGGFSAIYPGNFQPTGGTLELTGGFDNLPLYLDNGNYLHDFTINKAPGTGAQITSSVYTVKGNLTIQGGYLSAEPNRTIRVGGNWNNSVGPSGFIPGTGTVIFDGTASSEISGNANFFNLSLEKTGATPFLGQSAMNVSVSGLFNILSGRYVNYYNLTINSGIVYPGSEFNTQPGSVLKVQPGNSFDIYGWLNCQGIFGNPAYLESALPGGFYALNLNSGSVISASFTHFRNLDASGVNLHPGSQVISFDPDFQFYSCTFSDGAPGGTLLTISNNENFNVRYANFPANTWGGTSNVSKGVNAGHVQFLDYYGEFSGEAFDYDPNNRIDWVATNTLVTGSLTSGASSCFDATEILTVAGSGSTFTVNSGASATLIAGKMISLLEGTRVYPGGYLHAYITATNDFCGSTTPSLPSVSQIPDEPLKETDLQTGEMFRLYPNPSEGRSTLRYLGGGNPENVVVTVYSLQGERVTSVTYSAEKEHPLNLNNVSPGLYLIHVVHQGKPETLRCVVIGK